MSTAIWLLLLQASLGAFDTLKTYEVHVGQTEDVAGQGAGKQFKAAGAKKVLVVIHEASNSGLQQRADGVKRDRRGFVFFPLRGAADADAADHEVGALDRSFRR